MKWLVLVCFFITFNADARNLACPTGKFGN